MRSAINDTSFNVRLAYLAGILDGEGCLCIKRQLKVRHQRSPHYDLLISVSMSCATPPRIFHETFGGSFKPQKSRKAGAKQMHRWQCCALVAEQVLQTLLPYLIVKKEQAENLIDFRKLVKNGRKNNWRTRLTEEDIAARESLYQKNRRLNAA